MNSDLQHQDPVAKFMESPLVQWIQLLLNRNTMEIEDLLDGVLLNQIMLEIDPRPTNKKAHKNVRNDTNLNVQNLTMLIKHIKSYYEDIRKQVIVMSLPKVLLMVKNIRSSEGLAEMQKLLILILGCAVQCDEREQFINKMKQLTYRGMETMMNHIKYITEDTDNVLNMQWEELMDIPNDDLEDLARKMSYHIQKLVTERDDFYMASTNVSLERDYYQSQLSTGGLSRRDSITSPAIRQQLVVELNEIKLKWRLTKQELDEKMEQNTELKQENEDLHTLLQDTRKENAELVTDARSVRAMRDENDILKEKAYKATRLENELDMLKDKVKDIEFYKQRLSEIREDNKVLHETKELLEEQLELARTRLDGLTDAEKKIVELKRQLHDLADDRERDRLQIDDLMEANSKLEMDKQQSMNESGSLAYQLEQARGSMAGGRMSIKAESEESAHTRVLKLEKENKHLQALINTYKDSIKSSELTQASMVELEKENKRLSHRVQQLQEHISKEKQSVLDFEQLSNELAAERQRLETALETTRSSSERRIQELEEESTQLNKTIDSLRERAKIGGDAKIKSIEKENKVLSELIKDVTGKLNKSDYDRKEIKQQLNDMKDTIQQAEVTQMENAKLEKQNVSLEKTVKQLQITTANMEELEQKSSDLTVENKQLRRQVESLKHLNKQLEELEQDKNVSEQEATRLKRQVESLKKSCSRMSELEQDKLELEKRTTHLNQSMETMKASLKHKEKLEIVQVELENELDRVRSQLESSKKRLNDRSEDIYELERKNEQINSQLNQTVLQIKKLQRYEAENRDLSGENNKLEANYKKLNSELQRMKRTLEEQTIQQEELADDFEAVNRQNKTLVSRNEELEQNLVQSSGSAVEFKKLQKQAALERRTLSALREELVNEKLTSKQLQSELDRIDTELQDLGINKNELLKHGLNGDNDQRFKALESKLESTLQKSLSAKDEKIVSLESRLNESVNLNNKLRSDIKNMKRDYEALSQRHQEEGVENDALHNNGSATSEIFKIKDHLISVERKNATLLADNAALKNSSDNLESHVKSLQSQVGSLQRQNERAQETNDSLQTQCAKLQVENSTLQSQCSSLMLQNAQSTTTQSGIEAEKQDLFRSVSELRKEKEELEKAHDDMTALYERQTMELESLTQDHQKLKQKNRQLIQDQKELENKFEDLMKKNSEVSKKRLNESSLASGNLEAMKETHDKLNRSYKNLNIEYEDLQSDHQALKSSHNQLKLQFAKLEAESSDIRDHNQQLDITAAKLNNRCEVLMQLKLNLEEENKHLLEQIGRLMSQNEELLSQTLESKDQIYAEQKQYTERMQEIRRQKEKLEEKIMDIYRTPGHSPAKRTRGFGGTLKKAFQNLSSKGSDSRRKRDGLPPHGSSSNISNHSDQGGQGSLKRSTSPAPASEEQTANISRQDSGSQNSETPSTPADIARKNSVEKENKRRTKLGGLTYSTSALNQLSVQVPHPDLRKSTTALRDTRQTRGSSFSSQHHQSSLSGSTGDMASRDERSFDATSSESQDHVDGADSSPSNEKISYERFLHETGRTKEESPSGEKSQVVKPVPAKRSRSPTKKQPLRTSSWSTASFRHTPRHWPEDQRDKQLSGPAIYRAPPALDLSTLTDSTPITAESDSNRSPGKSPTSKVALIKIQEKEGEAPLTEGDRKNLKRDTMVFVVRSQSDASPRKKEEASPAVVVERNEVRMRSHPSSSQRPLSVHSKPTSSVTPVSSIPPRPGANPGSSVAQRLDSLLSSPRGANREGSATTSPRSYSGSQHVEAVPLRPKSSATLPRRPVSAVSPATTSGYVFNVRTASRTPYDVSYGREITSTPITSQRIDVATVSPIFSGSNPMIRKDVPPDVSTSAPSPIRRDVPPDSSTYVAPAPRRNRSYQDGDNSGATSSSEGASFQRRPPTPKKEASSNDTEKNTQWFEYGCV